MVAVSSQPREGIFTFLVSAFIGQPRRAFRPGPRDQKRQGGRYKPEKSSGSPVKESSNKMDVENAEGSSSGFGVEEDAAVMRAAVFAYDDAGDDDGGSSIEAAHQPGYDQRGHVLSEV